VLSIPGLLAQLELVLIEEDMYMRDTNGTSPSEDLIDYRLWHRHLEQAGFRQVWRSHDTFDPKNKPWSRFLYHSAWVRTTNTSYKQDENQCQLHKRAQGLSNEQLHCSTLHEGPWDPGNVLGGAV
jgi:hypothetical protein